MKQYKCKCGCIEFFTKESGSATGLYCKKCGKWIKWLGKDELYGLDCLKGKFFYNINHDILKDILKYFIEDKDVCWLCEKFIDSTDGLGVPLVNQISQVYALLYLSGLGENGGTYMGCHTWFSRPITKDEFVLMKEYAPIEIYNLTGNSKENIEMVLYDENLCRLLMKSLKENIPCVYGKYWWQLGWGSSNPNLLNGENNFIHEIKGEKGLFVDIKEYHGLFRIKNYPSKVIHSRHELRKWMKRKYFELEEWQLERISEFFKKYKNGVITFG